ncbi:MAG: hypothetical protein NTV00_02425 [Methylococcales bacterium]|nr:hypothetical protein [Methylococcales bacterium]
MHKNFNQHFQTRLWEVIADIERQSHVEVVVVIRSRAADYQDIPLYWGFAGAWLIHTYLMFIPTLFDDLTLYIGPLLAFMLFWLLGKIPSVQRLCVSKKRLQKNVEIMARALFQKGGMHHTQAKIGILIYCSLLEKTTFVLPDRGAEHAVPAEEWQLLRRHLQAIFATANPDAALLEQLAATQALFNRYLPPVDNDLNELPDNLDITL